MHANLNGDSLPWQCCFLSKGNNLNVFLEIKYFRVLGICELHHVTLGLVSDISILQTILWCLNSLHAGSF